MLGVALSGSEAVDSLPPAQMKPGFVFVSAGLLEPRKGGPLTLRAFQRIARSRPDVYLVFTNKGPELDRLTVLAQELGIADRVQFFGGLPSRAHVFGWIQAAGALILPSLRDSGGLVLLEAMMQEKPVICLDLGGPAEIVTDECGIKVRPGTRDQIVADLAAAMLKLASNPALARAMGQAGKRRVEEELRWDQRGEQMMKIYEEVAKDRDSALTGGSRDSRGGNG
jgi:glycosyltransferase involved in cell wall biosynthesis